MIQPVNALTPKVLFREGTASDSKESIKRDTRKHLALMNAAGISVVLGAATTAIARSNTSSWLHASYFGIAATLASMIFLVPGFMYKSGINTCNDKDVFLKEKKFLSEAGEIGTAAKNTTKNSIRLFPKAV